MPLDIASRPSAAAEDVQQWSLGSYTDLGDLRKSLFVALHGEPMPDDGELDEIPEKIVLVATELATNALAHGRQPTRVHLMRTEHTFVLDVADEDATTVPQPAGPRPPGQGGLGLHIVGELAGSVGWYAEGTTKHVWAEFPIPPAEAE